MPSDRIQWFPGHMAKTRRMIAENLKQVDLTIELLDARIPRASRNPEIARLTDTKPRLTLLSKASLADPAATAAWRTYLEERGEHPLFYDCTTGEGIAEIAPAAKRLCAEKLARYQEKGMGGRKLRAMIVGIPNVGKSTLVNRLAENKKAKVENRPGVTLDKQWVTTTIGLDLLDMPGVLWPKFEDPVTGENLALTGAIRDEIMDIEGLSAILVRRLRAAYPELLCARYKLGDPSVLDGPEDWEILEMIGKKRGFLVSGGEISYERTANMLLDEFRAGKIGRITLERPEKRQGK